jgi:hypothetical protein
VGTVTPDSLLLADAVRVPLSSHGNSGSDAPILLGVGFLIGAAFMYLGAKKWRVGRLIKNTPTERVRSVAVGRTEVNGICRDTGVTYEQPYTDGECVYRHWEVEEYRESSDPDDNSSEWVAVDSGTDVVPFFLEDDTGQILIDTTEGPYFEISDGNSYSTKVGAHEQAPPEVRSFSGGSAGFLGIDEDTDPAEVMEKVPMMGTLGGMFGGEEMTKMMQGSQAEEMRQTAEAGEDGQSPEEMQHQFMQQYFDEDVLDENGQLREDVSEQELAEAMDDDVQGMGPAAFMTQMSPDIDTGGDSDGDDSDDSDASGTQRSDEDTGSPSAANGGEQGSQADVIQELGGTGTTGSMGTGSSLSRKLISAGLSAATGGRWGSSLGDGGGLLGSGGNVNSYNRRRFSHEVLPVDEEVYIFGEATPRKNASGSNASRLKIAEETTTGQFVVSDRSEEGIVKRYSWRGPLYVLLGLVISAACLGGLLIVLGVA